MELYIIRHGEPDYTTDTLTPYGKLQAEALSKKLEKTGIDQIYTSPRGRAIQTAEPTCQKLGLPYTIEEWAYEIGNSAHTTYPDGVDTHITDLQTTLLRDNGQIDLPFSRTFECSALAQSNMEEEFHRVREAGEKILEKLGYQKQNDVYKILNPSEDRVALFCHAIFARVWLSDLLHIPLHIMWSSFFAHHLTGVTVLRFKNNEDGFTSPQCLTFSDTSHLYAEGLPSLHSKQLIN